MFIVVLKFGENKEKAPEFMEGHKAWLAKGFEDGVFVLAGSLIPGLGGSVIVQGVSAKEVEALVNEDPFVIEKVVTSEIMEIAPSRVDDRLEFLLEG